jgi:hypothetical protein
MRCHTSVVDSVDLPLLSRVSFLRSVVDDQDRLCLLSAATLLHEGHVLAGQKSYDEFLCVALRVVRVAVVHMELRDFCGIHSLSQSK